MPQLRFADFEFDPASRQLRRRGRTVTIQDLPLRALEILLEKPRKLVPRQVFFERLWPDDHSGLLDDNLNTTLHKLRQVLRDPPNKARLIETVPKRGYRFIAPLEVVGDEAEANPPRSNGQATTARWRGVLLPAAILAVGLVAIALYTLRPGASPEVSAEAPPTVRSADGVRTLAVLPFTNASDQASDEYFSSGLTDEIIYRLGREPGIQVVARSSAAAIHTGNLGARAIGDVLNADLLVEGTVRRNEARLRVDIQLVDARSDLVMWSEHFDREQQDLFNLQEDIANTIATMVSGPSALASRGPKQHALSATNAEAYDRYLQGRFYWHRRTRDGLHRAVQEFHRSTELAPDYAPAWAGLADALAVLGFYDYLPPGEAFPGAREAAGRALALDPDDVSAHATLGYVALYYDWDLTQAEQHFLDAIALQPGDSKAHQWYANLLTAAGRFEEAEREMRLAQQLDPLSLIANAALGWVQYFAGRHAQALHQFQLTLELSPEFELAYLWRGWTLAATGDMEGALEASRTAVEMSAGGGVATASLAYMEALVGDSGSAIRRLEEMEASGEYLPAYEMSKAWFAAGEYDRALAALNRALDGRSHSMVFLPVDPQMAGFRNDARVQAMITESLGSD